MSLEPQTLLCVGAVVLRGDRVLLVRQAKGHPLEGPWTIPWGIVDSPEPPEVAVLRETLEEGATVGAKPTTQPTSRKLLSSSTQAAKKDQQDWRENARSDIAGVGRFIHD